MADAYTRITDTFVPDVWAAYMLEESVEKLDIFQAGVLYSDPEITAKLANGGYAVDMPMWHDLADIPSEPVNDDPTDLIEIKKLTSRKERAARNIRAQAFGVADLTAVLAGDDPMNSIAQRVATYWARRLQAAFIATWQGVCKDNGVNDSGDYANDIVGASFVDGVTNFSAEAYLDAKVTMGDSMEDLSMVMVHSVVYNRMQKNNLIDFIPDARGETQIPTFLGAEVIVDDGMPSGTSAVRGDGTASVANTYETWLFGSGATQLGVGSAKVPTEVERQASAGNGGGSETLHSRQEWSIHPVGHAFTAASPANGGPSNAATTNNLNIATSWNRVYGERKQVKFAKLITREA